MVSGISKREIKTEDTVKERNKPRTSELKAGLSWSYQ